MNVVVISNKFSRSDGVLENIVVGVVWFVVWLGLGVFMGCGGVVMKFFVVVIVNFMFWL